MSTFHKPSLSDLNLQLFLYFNALYSLFFSTITISCSIQKLLYFDKIISISVVVIFTFVEPFRIYFGLSGNLREEVSSLATLVLLSVFPQSLFIGYLAYYQPIKFPCDPILGSIMLIFLFAEIILGFKVAKAAIQYQTLQLMRQLQTSSSDSVYDYASPSHPLRSRSNTTEYQPLRTHED